MRVLIAEDQAIPRRMLEATLRRWGHEVIACRDGGEALEHFLGPSPPQIGILDWDMPVMDGAQVCRHLRASPAGALVYLVLLTGKTERTDLVEGLEAGADDYLTKPFDPDELRARVRVGQRVLDLQRRLVESERDRVLSETAGGAAHEIYQPLTVIMGTAQLLMISKGPADEERADVEAIYKAGKEIEGIVGKMARARSYAARAYVSDSRIADFDRAGGEAKPNEET